MEVHHIDKHLLLVAHSRQSVGSWCNFLRGSDTRITEKSLFLFTSKHIVMHISHLTYCDAAITGKYVVEVFLVCIEKSKEIKLFILQSEEKLLGGTITEVFGTSNVIQHLKQ